MSIVRRICLKCKPNRTLAGCRRLSSGGSPPLGVLRPLIGLEVHAQLSTSQKLFSPSRRPSSPSNSSSSLPPPNTLLSPFDVSIPGSLPVLNKECVSKAIVAAAALGCEIRNVSRFERKHYKYPDLPHGYQITQNKHPIAVSGSLLYCSETGKSTKVKQVQLETDTGKSKRVAPGSEEVDVDYNRAGSALIEVVFEPDIMSAKDAASALRALRDLLKSLGVCDGRFELGEVRCDLNVSMWKGEGEMGDRVEVKNMNSIRAVAAAAIYEIKRQTKALESGGTVTRETRMFDKREGVTVPMRGKEEINDYRFLVDPDVPPLVLSEIEGLDVSALVAEAAATEEDVGERLAAEHGIKADAANVLAANAAEAEAFVGAMRRAAVGGGDKGAIAKVASSLLCNEVLALKKEAGEEGGDRCITSEQLYEVSSLCASGDITNRTAKDVVKAAFEGGKGVDVGKAVEERGGRVIKGREQLRELCGKVVDGGEFDEELGVWLGGDKKLRSKMEKFFFGKVMKEARGAADPSLLREALVDVLKERES